MSSQSQWTEAQKNDILECQTQNRILIATRNYVHETSDIHHERPESRRSFFGYSEEPGSVSVSGSNESATHELSNFERVQQKYQQETERQQGKQQQDKTHEQGKDHDR